jgi:ligand-binding sensor domain-containing protein
MKFIHTMKIFAGTLLCLSLLSQVANSQTYSFKNYGAENNIPSGFIYTIVQSDDGFLWVGTGNGLARFDGYNFYPVQFPDSSQLRIITSGLKDKSGTLWFGCNDGSVYRSNKNSLIEIKLSNEKAISALAEGPDGLIINSPSQKTIYWNRLYLPVSKNY